MSVVRATTISRWLARIRVRAIPLQRQMVIYTQAGGPRVRERGFSDIADAIVERQARNVRRSVQRNKENMGGG